MTRAPLPDAIPEQRIIAIARRVPHDRLMTMVDVLATAGIDVIEVTLDGEDALTSVGRLAERGVVVGAGTVRTRLDAERALDAGARFLVSPHTDPDLVSFAVDRGVPMMPGAMTPTEVARAWQLGASAVKLFPATVGGPAFVTAIRGPLGDIPIVPTGGVDAANAPGFLDAGAMAVGVGGWLTGSADERITAERARLLVAAVERA
jgi:2-dehydro-3-deoxyphosphogluconate aldolase/(4S)-4-hydroxy-2-oxoglutarate aldolase